MSFTDKTNFQNNMDKLIKSKDGHVWINVTDKAQAVFETGLFSLQSVWGNEDDDTLIRVPINTQEELNTALQTDKSVCIYGGMISDSISLGFVTQDSWTSAAKISHNGNIYVRFKDLVFCK